jgi:ribose transport system permease protein
VATTVIERNLRQLLAVPEFGIALALLIVTVVFWLIKPALLNVGGVTTLLRSLAFVGIIAVGETLLLIAGELDLSVGSVAGLCAIVAAWLMKERGWPVVPGLLAGLVVGGGVGLVNGILAVGARIPPFIVTLGMLYIARGLDLLLCGGYPIYPLPAAFTAMGKAAPLGLSWAFVVFVATALMGQLILSRTVYGRAIYATGGNCEVARIAGIRTGAVKISCYVLTGTLAALAGVLLMGQLGVGQPDLGEGWELAVIASIVIGGVSLFGGIGSVTGTALGLLLMQVVRSGLVLSDVNTHWQTVAVGGIMTASVGVDLLRRRAKIME